MDTTIIEEINRLCNIAVNGNCIDDEIGGCPFPDKDDMCGECFAQQICKLFEPLEQEIHQLKIDKDFWVGLCGGSYQE